MRVMFLILTTFLFSHLSFASEKSLQSRMDQLKLLQDRVNKECINNPNAKKYSVKMDGKTLKCPDLIKIADLLQKKLNEDMQKHKTKCEQENKKSPHTVLANDTASIVQKSAACTPSPDKDKCLGGIACGMLAVTVPVTAIAEMLTKSPVVKECKAQAYNMPACMANIMRGIFDSIWSALSLLWDVSKWAVTSAAEWMGIIKESEAKSSEKAMMAQQASPGFLKQFTASPVETMKNMAKELYASIEDAAINHYGCEKWSGAPFVSTCLQPMATWDCGSCQQKSQVFCGVAGYAIGEIGTAFLTGGVVSGAKIALKGAVRVASGPAKNVAGYMGKTFPKASAEVAEAAGKVKALASAGLTSAQQKLFAAWHAVSNSAVTKAIATAAKVTGVSKVASVTLKPIGAYLNAMDKAFVAGMNSVDNLGSGSAKAAMGAKIADEAMEVSAPGLVVEGASSAAKAAKTAEASAASRPAAQGSTASSEASVSKTSKSGEATAANEADELADIAKYRQDPEYMELFKGAPLYADHHKELSMVIKALEETTPKLTKQEIRIKIQETLNSCSL